MQLPYGPDSGTPPQATERRARTAWSLPVHQAIKAATDQPTAVLAAAFSVVSALVFGAQWIYLERFWGVFGLRPEEVGIDQVAMITRGIVATLLGLIVLALIPMAGYCLLLSPVVLFSRTLYASRYIEWTQTTPIIRATILVSYSVAAGHALESSYAWQSFFSDAWGFPRASITELGVFAGTLVIVGVFGSLAMLGVHLCTDATWEGFLRSLAAALVLVVGIIVLFGSESSAESLKNDLRPMNRSIFGISLLDVRSASIEISGEAECGFIVGDQAARYVLLTGEGNVSFFPAEQSIVRLDPEDC